MRHILSAFFICILLVGNNYGQSCGVTFEDGMAMLERLSRNKAYLEKNPGFRKSNNTIYVPVSFHLVAEDDASNRISERTVLQQLCQMNKDFQQTGLQFFLNNGTFDYVDNSTVYNDPGSASRGIMDLIRDNSAVDIWIVGNTDDNDNSNGVTLGYYSRSFDWVVIDKSQISGEAIGLSHELGHFFSLPHPFLGWDADPYQADKHGNPAPVRAPGGNLTEYMDGSNCETAGDRICDTPPDYNFGFTWTRDCNYRGGAKDPRGEDVDPDEYNIVGYFLPENSSDCIRSSYRFTEDQSRIMNADYEAADRRYLRNNAVAPTTEVVTEIPVLTLPLNEATVADSKPIALQWEAVPHADSYLVEVDLIASFVVRPLRIVVNTHELELDPSLLFKDRTYYWRVTPFNALGGCAGSSTTKQFRVSSVTSVNNTIPEMESLFISPNPHPANQNLNLSVNVNGNFQAAIDLFDTNGKLIRAFGEMEFIVGKNDYRLPSSALEPGVYALSIKSQKGKSVQRIIIY